VHHRAPADGDLLPAAGPAGAVDHGVLDMVAHPEVIGHGAQFAGVGVAMRVGALGAADGPAEIADPQRFQFLIQFCGGAARPRSARACGRRAR